VTFLLDVNSLIAWHHAGAPHHARFHAWAGAIGPSNLHTCALSELGFIRVSMQVFGYSLRQATSELDAMRRQTGGFIDHAPPPGLPAWAGTPARTSDAYLVQVAVSRGMKLATFDTGIKDAAATLIPRP
jgi:predicted nucleic acid-binding protein